MIDNIEYWRKEMEQVVTAKKWKIKEQRISSHDMLCDLVNNIDLAKNCSRITLRVMLRGREVCVVGGWRCGL